MFSRLKSMASEQAAAFSAEYEATAAAAADEQQPPPQEQEQEKQQQQQQFKSEQATQLCRYLSNTVAAAVAAMIGKGAD